MEFLRPNIRPKIIRTRLYGDQEFSKFELELLHTPIIQRLYDLKQLGFTDRVYPDAVHARFNHILGATKMVDAMADRLGTWLCSQDAVTLDFAAPADSGRANNIATVSAAELAEQLTVRRSALRLMALLHDVTHVAFGHTLEDEVNVFDEKHDNPARQLRFFDALVAQLLYTWCTEVRLRTYDAATIEALATLNLSPDQKRERGWAQELAAYLSRDEKAALAQHMRELELALTLLLHIEFAHTGQAFAGASKPLLAGVAAGLIDQSVPALEFVLCRDLFMVDMVGNTICADLLDYAKRDADNAGLKVQFDDRFLRYLCVVSVRDRPLSPTGAPCIRTAIQIFTDKMRHDVLSEMSGILKARYLINERVLFHPTKCAAGAMLGTAVQLLGLRNLPQWVQVLGDQEFLRTLVALAAALEILCSRLQTETSTRQSWREVVQNAWSADEPMQALIRQAAMWIVPSMKDADHPAVEDLEQLQLRASAARNVLAKLGSRRFPKLAYRIRTAHDGRASDESIAQTYCTPKNRYDLERQVEKACNLPAGTVFVHCPKRKTSMKVAEVLVVGKDLNHAERLRDVTKLSVSPEGLEPYQNEILAIEEMYRSIWQFHAYLDLAYWDKQPIVEWALHRALRVCSDDLLAEELSHEPPGMYHFLANDLKDEIPDKWFTDVICRVDNEVPTRMRLAPNDQHHLEQLRSIIRQVLAEAGASTDKQLGLPGIQAKTK
jgi:HD superfamily phosphohydrolase